MDHMRYYVKELMNLKIDGKKLACMFREKGNENFERKLGLEADLQRQRPLKFHVTK